MSDLTNRVRELVEWVALFDRGTGDLPEWQHLEDDEAWFEDLNGVELGDCLSEAERIIRSARAVKAHIEEYLADDIVEHGAIRLGDSGYYVGSKTNRKLIDAPGLLKWLNTPFRIDKAVRITAKEVRIRVVRGYAKEDNMKQAVMDSFFEETKDEKALGKAHEKDTVWVQRLKHGERR